MEALIAVLIGWVGTTDEIINLQTGLRIRNVGDGSGSRAELVYPNGDVEEYDGPNADAIFDRAELLLDASDAFMAQLNTTISQLRQKGANQ